MHSTRKKEIKTIQIAGRLLPEHVDLGLRLTVGEDVLQKPFLESSLGDGKFPEANKSGRSEGLDEDNLPYYPSLKAGGSGLLPGEVSAQALFLCTLFFSKRQMFAFFQTLSHA